MSFLDKAGLTYFWGKLKSYFQSLGPGTAIAANTDLNTIGTVGNYHCATNATAATLTNCPISNAFTMKVGYATGTGYIYQEITQFNGGFKYYRWINQNAFDGTKWSKWFQNTPRISYATCSTAADTAAKVATIPDTKFGFQLMAGVIVGIKFSATNTAQNPTLNVNGSGAKSIYANTAVITTGNLAYAGVANRVLYFMYDGTYWCWMAQGVDSNTTYSAMSQTEYDTGTATTGRLVTAALLKSWISAATSTYTAVTGKPTANQTPAFGGVATVSQVKQDASGQVTVTDRTIKIPNTTATTTDAGLMSAGDKTKLEGIEAGAEVNPTYTAVTGKPTGNQTPAFGGVATISQVKQAADGQVSVTDRTIKIPDTEASTSSHGLMSADDKTKLNYTNVAYATCSTAAATAAKVATINGNTEFSLQTGAIVGVKFTNTNTAQNPTLNVGSTGAKSVVYNTAVVTTGSLNLMAANRVTYFMYDGTNWVFLSWSVDNNTTYSAMSQSEYDTGTSTTGRLVTPALLKSWNNSKRNVIYYGICSTAAGTKAKTVTVSPSGFSLENGVMVAVTFAYSSTVEEMTLNVNSTGAKAIARPDPDYLPKEFINSYASYILFIYDGEYWQFVGNIFHSKTGKPTTNQTPAFGGTATVSQVTQDATGQITVTDRTIKIPNTTASTSAAGLMSADDKTKLNYTNVAYGTCSTDAGTAAKVVTISGNTKFALQVGAIVGIKFTYTNTAASPTINVGGTGAKSLKYQATAPYTTGNWVCGQAGYVNYYMYDGEYWVFMTQSQDRNTTYSAMSQTEADTGTATTARLITAKVLTDTIVSKVRTPTIDYFIQDKTNIDPISATYYYSDNFTIPAGYWCLSVAVEWNAVNSTQDAEEYREAVLLKASDSSAPGIISYDRVAAISRSTTYNRFVYPVKLTSATAYKIRLKHNNGAILTAKVRAYWVGLAT